jgi:hypothetical protein
VRCRGEVFGLFSVSVTGPWRDGGRSVERTERTVRVVSVRAGSRVDDIAARTPAERVAMMWQLALDAWAFKGDTTHAESRLQRHVGRVHRGGR